MTITIHTRYPLPIITILVQEDIAPRGAYTPGEGLVTMSIPPIDTGAQQKALKYWLAMAQGCRLIESWEER